MTVLLQLKVLFLLTAMADFVQVSSATAGPLRDVYFSTLEDIQVIYTNSTTSVVFSDPYRVGPVSCNPNPLDNRRIYWVDYSSDSNRIARIMRGIPNVNDSIEEIVTRDLIDPRGLAVDWAANQIYFSQRRSVDGLGRIEVVSSDGSKRKVLFSDLLMPGPIAINIVTGYLYYFDSTSLCRSFLDGSNRELVIYIVDEFDPDELKGLSVDVAHNMVYWTQGSTLKWLHIQEYEDNGNEDASDLVKFSLVSDPMIHDISAFNNSIYWTILRQVTFNSTSNLLHVTSPGALYHANLRPEEGGSGENMSAPMLLVKDQNLSPLGLCTFHSVEAMASSPCSVNNICDRDAFCFTVPDGVGGTRSKCGCPTGLMLNTNNYSCPSVPHNFLLFSQHFPSDDNHVVGRTELRMLTLDNDPPFVDIQLPIDLHSTEATFVTYDQLRNKIYWTELDPPSIMRANIDGTQIEVFVDSSISRPESLSIDPYSGNLYWADSELDSIYVARIDSPHIRKRLFSIRHPLGLSLDIARGYMYWSDRHASMPSIEEARLNGSDRRVVSSAGIQTPTGVSVDTDTGAVYWIDYSISSGRSSIIRYMGGVEIPLNIPGLRVLLGLAVNGDYIYWTDQDSSSRPLGRADKILGTSSSFSVLDGLNGLRGLVAVNTATRAVNTRCFSANTALGNCRELCLPNGNDTQPSCACTEHFHLSETGECVDELPRVYVSNTTHIMLLNTTFSDSWSVSDQSFSLGEGVVTRGLEADLRDGMLYWIDESSKMIMRHSLPTSTTTTTTTTTSPPEVIISCCLRSPEDIAVDWFGRNLYWTDSERRVIEVSRLDGEGRSILYIVPEDLGEPANIALDPFRGHIYWSPKTELKIYRIEMDGTGTAHVLYRQFFLQESSSSSAIFSLSLNFNISGDQLFSGVKYTGSDGEVNYRFLSSDLHLGDKHQFFIHRPTPTSEVFVMQAYKNFIYFMFDGRDSSVIDQFDRTNHVKNSVFLDRSRNYFLDSIIVHHSIQPGDHVCQIGDHCQGSSLCLASDGVTGLCQCSPLRVKMEPLLFSDEKPSCVSTESFLLLATEQYIHYLPVPRASTQTKGSVRPLPLTPRGRVMDLAFDPMNHSVLWVESGNNTLFSVAIDSMFEWDIPLSMETELHPFSLAYDWKGGHAILTETDGFELILSTPDGHFGTLLNFDIQHPSNLLRPYEVVFDSDAGILYWTTTDRLTDYGKELKYLPLSNISNISSIPLNNRRISNLTFEPLTQSLFWINHAPSNTTIELYNLTSGSIEVVAENADCVEALSASSVLESASPDDIVVYLYWYNRTDQFLYRFGNGAGQRAERYVYWDVPTRVVSIIGYRNTIVPTDLPCRSSERPCTHICVPGTTPAGDHLTQCPSGEDCFCGCPVSNTLNASTGACTKIDCGPLQFSCGDDFGTCFPGVYFCDRINHCRNNFDEECPDCNMTTEIGCYSDDNNDPVHCIPMSARCDNISQCANNVDESLCCGPEMFGCYVNDSQSWSNVIFFCLDNMSLCDGTIDCADGSDENETMCDTISTTEVSATNSPGKTPGVLVIIAAVFISIFILLILVVMVMCIVMIIWKRQDDYRVGGRAPHHSISYSTTSPRVRIDSQSDCCTSECSHGTHTTQLGNGSMLSPCGGSKVPDNLKEQANMVDPPPSPISTIQHPRHSLALSEEDDISTYSQTYSEYNRPPPPCPSINYDNVSGNMSFSVSQTHFPATINPSVYPGGGGGGNHYHHVQHQGLSGGGGAGIGASVGVMHASATGGGGGGGGGATGCSGSIGSGGGGGRQQHPQHHHGGRNLNPLLARTSHMVGGTSGSGASASASGGGGGGGGTHGPGPSPSHQSSLVSYSFYTRHSHGHHHHHHPYHHHHHQYPHITELDHSDTDSTVSIGSERDDEDDEDEEDYQYNISMPPPPGRPPSPATVYSGYPGMMPMSPRSSTSSHDTSTV